MNYHIFQNHFSKIEEYLSKKDISHSAKLMEKEAEKIENSLITILELMKLFENANF